jgi:UDP-glucose 6-dehydrogenase
MNVVMIGAGYVGLVSGACFAEFGASVICVDKQEARIDALREGRDTDLRTRARKPGGVKTAMPGA